MSKKISVTARTTSLIFLLILLFYISGTSATVTISANKLFQNTVKRWSIDIKDADDRRERWNRLIQAKRAVERTTSGVTLETLNPFTVANDKEYEKFVKPLFNGVNTTEKIIAPNVVPERISMRKKRAKPSLPPRYDFWEKEVGLSSPRDQAACGSCWSFPNVGTMEALNKHLTGDDTEFSEQYFVDCTFTYSGCAGGSANEGYKLTLMRQYMMSAEDWPYTADYQPCKFAKDIATFKNNALNKIWIQDYSPLSKNEEGLMEGLLTSPVSFGTHISGDLYSYSGGEFRDTNCAKNPVPHAMLLVGYTEKTLRVKASYGTKFGDYGYINYVRGDKGLENCGFFNSAFKLFATYRRDLEYEYCNDGHPTTYQNCRDSCKAMNTKKKSGWDLAVIPTKYHDQIVVDKLAGDFPGVQTNDKFRLFWIGLLDEDRTETYTWVDEFTPAHYLNISRNGGGNRYGLIDKNSGEWITKNSLTFEARGLCSRPVNCWNIEDAISDATVTFSRADLSEGTVATVVCEEGLLVGTNKLMCVGGQWDQSLPSCSIGGSEVGTCTVVKSNILTVNPVEEDFVSEGEKLTVTCKNNKEISHILKCSGGVFQPAFKPKKLCSTYSSSATKVGGSFMLILVILVALV